MLKRYLTHCEGCHKPIPIKVRDQAQLTRWINKYRDAGGQYLCRTCRRAKAKGRRRSR